MILILHILAALGSIIFSTFAYFYPSHKKLNLSYTLVGLTLASGTWMVLATTVSLLHVCLSGLLYLGFLGSGLVLVRAKVLDTK